MVKLGAIMTDKRATRRGTTLMEVAVVSTIIGILAAMSAPSFQRAMEQSRADLAGANLRAIWSAERLYWLEYRTYTTDLSLLQSLGLIDTSIISSQAFYVYQVSSSGANNFTATATRALNARWNGTLSIDDTGLTSGELTSTGDLPIAPNYQ